eukprot:scaffold6180_cov194-Alexandrium_tamarense.AAC.7
MQLFPLFLPTSRMRRLRVFLSAAVTVCTFLRGIEVSILGLSAASIHETSGQTQTTALSSATSTSLKSHLPRFILENVKEKSAQLLLERALTPRPVDDDEVLDETTEAERCKRYNLRYNGRKTRRRIFYGSLIADDSWATIAISALEHYGMLHSVAFVEGDRTQMRYERKIRFFPESDDLQLLQSGIYGPNTKVTVDYYLNEQEWIQGLARENHQRSVLFKRWRENGMQHDDIGYIADVDEMFTRDFLRAMQICEVKEFDDHNNCKGSIKVESNSAVFEGGPECLTSVRCLRPDLIVGECIEGIGDPTHRPIAPRFPEGRFKPGFMALDEDFGPLWWAVDFRMTQGNSYGKVGSFVAGYHVHNFFPNELALRKKYKTYGHPVENAMEIPLEDIQEDLKPLIACATRKEGDKGSKSTLVEGGLKSLGEGSTPLAFQVEGYVDARMSELREMLGFKDEK